MLPLSFLVGVKGVAKNATIGLMLKFGVPIVFALAVLDRYANKERLVHIRRGGKAVAGFF
jgi:hypothetical protein